MSDQGTRPIVDFGGHLHPTDPEAFAYYHDFIEENDGSTICRDAQAVRRRYANAAVDYAVLSQPYFMGYGDADETAAANDELLRIVEEFDEFFGLAAVPTAAGGKAAANELERSLEAGYHGGAIETKSDGIELIDDELEPVFRVAEKHDAPLLVHPKLHDSLHEDVLDDTWRLNAIFGREVALCESICKVIHEGVLDRHPELNLVYHHTGGNLAAMLDRVRLQLDDDLWPGLDDVVSYQEFEAAFETRIYVDTSGYDGSPAVLRRTLEALPSSHVLFGTDFPYETRTPETFESLVTSVTETCSESDSERILGENALELLANT
ncbi:amidohydrolase family protein [Natrarchaeobius oligotrophus]|uniref:Amidohydrolase-related domain-containing protein n=1 Tax=Natrarchaeobius chitinivorans TaxID=1679083 RepID=A0A3N6PLN3_NATCH|nr:amidohydrolase family protein [Natrarchaeobius chitinivorans]RQH02380.1 hypothetical protein EA472_03500 [Natrarchaeobius chitinivorans]